ncbi:glycosyltransferase [Nocardia brasiliensis]|uniref:glycosyltransferase n=1 Tax=Nocardia brasiliensis TaxID=37326 RepID=UPI0024587C75|nr:glycosyltransferase [Nocardia brasiliensis]
MLVGVCDFPGRYAFPPTGYAGIERWLWAVAVGARRAGARVHLLGPQWRGELNGEWTVRPVRLETLSEAELAEFRDARYDLLVAWHEYPALPAWRQAWQALDCAVASFQHGTNRMQPAGTFDGERSRLYCYSTEMMTRYAAHRPRAELAVHLGLGEDEPPAAGGTGLVWVGRIVADKAPHLAVSAARLLGRRITLVGPVFDDDYLHAHRDLFGADHVRFAGELGGPAKTAAFHDGAVFVYTCARDYVEAGAAVFGEALRAGTPVAALAWRAGTCAEAALCAESGRIARVEPDASDECAAAALATAIEAAATLDAAAVQAVGLARYDPAQHFRALAGLAT